MSPDSLTIRQLRPEDHPQVMEVARGLADWFRPLDQLALVMDLQEHEGLVALEESRVLGFLTYHRLDSRRAELSWLGVARSTQDRGVGGALLRALEERLRAGGIRTLQLHTVPADADPTFAPTNRFYFRHGYRLAARDDTFYAHGRPGIRLDKEL